MLSVAVAVIFTFPDTVAPFAGAVIDTEGAVVSRLFATVTVATAEVVRLPAASRAVAERVWLPFATVAVFHETEYGEAVSSAPSPTPSSKNCTPTTPMSSDAFAETVIEPETVAPDIGDEIATVGGVMSASSVSRIASKLKYWASVVSLRMWLPAVRLTPSLASSHWKVVHAPVIGTTTGPLLSTPSMETWNWLLASALLRSASIL